MRKIRDKGIAKLYAAAVRASKNGKGKRHKATKRPAKRHSRPQALTARGKAKAAHVMREFYHGDLTSHGHRVARPDVAKAIAMSEGRRTSRPATKRRRKTAKRATPKHSRPQVRTAKRRSPTQLDHRVIRHPAPAHKVSRGKAKRHSRPQASPAQLAARAKFVAMVRARAASTKGRGSAAPVKGRRKAAHDKKGPNRTTSETREILSTSYYLPVELDSGKWILAHENAGRYEAPLSGRVRAGAPSAVYGSLSYCAGATTHYATRRGAVAALVRTAQK